ncbi:MAG: RDD family protein [Betaproteobacteria bacterium]|nr:MAG: RDD family protein [Betaproteobacteria bacterium]TMH45992.1 MAG: RDD family protein [Betaproteobacteria bacterium]TMH76481.1 MAG: RDD family protein [Betaproteobacteria bacterium]
MTEDTVKREPRYVGFWKRLAASIIDIIILVAIIAPIEIAIFGRGYLVLAMQGKTLAVDIWVQLILPLVAAILLWRYRSATPGLMLMSARIVDAATLAPASMRKLVIRAVVLLVMWIVIIPLVGVLWIAFDKRKQGWHDKLAGTVVIQDEDD